MLKQYPDRPKTLEILRDRFANDPDEKLCKFAQKKLTQLEKLWEKHKKQKENMTVAPNIPKAYAEIVELLATATLPAALSTFHSPRKQKSISST